MATVSSLAVGALSTRDPTYWSSGVYFDALVAIQFALAICIFVIDRNQNGRLSAVTAASYDLFEPHLRIKSNDDSDDEQRPLAEGEGADDENGQAAL